MTRHRPPIEFLKDLLCDIDALQFRFAHTIQCDRPSTDRPAITLRDRKGARVWSPQHFGEAFNLNGFSHGGSGSLGGPDGQL